MRRLELTLALDEITGVMVDFRMNMKIIHAHSKPEAGLLTLLLWLFCLIGLMPSRCPAEHQAPSIDRPIEIDAWRFIGPFSAGPREEAHEAVGDPADLGADSLGLYPSPLVQGGYVGWKTAETDSTGRVNIEFEGVLWDTLMDIYGYAGIANQTYAYCELDVPVEVRALVEAERVGSFWLNRRLWPGDPYQHGFMKVPVILKQGRNTIVLSLSGYGDHTFRFALLPVPGPVMTLQDHTLPDIVRGEEGLFWAGITVLNTTSDRLEGILVKAGDGRLTAVTERSVTPLPAFCLVKIPIQIAVNAVPDSEDILRVPIAVEAAGSTFRDSLDLRLRGPGQSVKRTFISGIDSSCQYYAVLPPTQLKADGSYALILTLHGANVEAHRQVDAYRPKSWAYVVAPTNRRRYGFDWQDWGLIDALEVLKIAQATLPVDSNRVYLTGHSMGGHGAWHVGLSHPDLFAALAPAAGWTCFELYVPWFLQKSYIYGEPVERSVRETALRQDWAHNFVENALNLPVFVLQGGRDDNVPPFHSRLLTGDLHRLRYRYQYKEDPDRGHWYRIDSLDVACVDDPDLIGFLQDKVRDPFPRDIMFKTVNPSHSGRAYWLEILEQENLYRESTIEARVTADTVRVETHNVRSFAVTLSRGLIPSGRAVVEVEGQCHHLAFNRQETFHFSRRGGSIRLGENHRPGLRKDCDLYGPIKQAMFSPFVLIYGTRGGAPVTDLLLHLARLEAFQWWRRGNGFVEVMPDSEVTAEVIADRNLILFGGPDHNSVTRRISRHLPIRLVRDGVLLGQTHIPGDGLAVKFVYPNPLAPANLVVVSAGTDSEGLALLTYMRTVYAGAGVPDFIIFDREVKRRGWGGIIAAGFFDSAWRVDPDLLFYRGE